MFHEQRRSADRGTRSTKFDNIRRASVHFSAYIVGIVAATALVGALSAPTALATTPTYELFTTDKVELRNGECSHDITSSWATIITTSDTLNQQVKNDFTTAMAGGLVVVTLDTFNDPNQKFATVYYKTTRDDVPELKFDPGLGYYFGYWWDEYSSIPFTKIDLHAVNKPDCEEIQAYSNGREEYGAFLAVSSTSTPPWRIATYSYNYEYTLSPDISPEFGEIPGTDVENPLYQDPWNLPPVDTEDCDWWNLTCFMGTVDFNPIRDVADQASQNLGFVGQFGEIIGELTSMMTDMPDSFAGVDPCWTTGMAGFCKIPVNIFGTSSEISLYQIRNSPVMQAIMPWLLYAMIGLMSWNLFKGLPKIIEEITQA